MPATCTLPECDRDLPEGRKKFCSETHARRNRQRAQPAEPLPEERQEEELRAALRRAQAATVRAKAKTEDLIAAVYLAARDASLAQGPVPAVPSPVLPKGGKGKEEVALIHTSDWQYGKETESYNMAKCANRIALLADKIGLMTAIQRTEHPISSATVLFGGDIVENLNIFPGQAYEVEAGLYEQIFGAVSIGEKFLRQMLSIFTDISVIGEPGNHGRFGRRGDFPATDNADRIVYKILQEKFAHNPRVHWQEYHSFYQPFSIGNYRSILIHGDEIKSFGGNTPAFGLLRKGTAWASGAIKEDFKDIYFGHYHTPMELMLPNGGVMYGVGSTESDNVYAQEFVAARGAPTQRLHYIDPRKGRVTCRYTVYLDDDETLTQP